MIRLIASDMDGTLLNEEMVISKENADMIKMAEKKGIRFIVSTGRGYTEAKPLIQTVGINCPMITLNGAQIYDEKGQLVESNGITYDLVMKIIHLIEKYHLYFELVTSKGIFSDNKVKRIENIADLLTRLNPETPYKMAVALASARLELMNISYVDSYRELLADPDVEVLKLIAFSNSDAAGLNAIKQELNTIESLAVTSSFATNIEINHVNAQKGIALTQYAKDLDIPLAQVFAIGDNLNDVSMLKVAGVSYAMGNADPIVQKIAKFSTKNNNENGVALAIQDAIDHNR